MHFSVSISHHNLKLVTEVMQSTQKQLTIHVDSSLYYLIFRISHNFSALLSKFHNNSFIRLAIVKIISTCNKTYFVSFHNELHDCSIRVHWSVFNGLLKSFSCYNILGIISDIILKIIPAQIPQLLYSWPGSSHQVT